ncbi:glycoside hydrolase family 43 protein [Gaoshiqia sediminis]|uniref:Glycoside hydrolase family 43 protein n=1 Tax=Gaoshiqia sediminis TaxID=2986998 RepID=A0AA42C8Z6_9BACT|nr:glycoside hydrolase family 43 protein [Gaoshiqia sediminis]MCW0481832.1 glycoside hydrolase family 43 protein [Gaoshiqia sediminis]
MMKRAYLFLLVLLAGLVSCQQASEKEYYVFTTFREPADKGLFLAYSEDGYHWSDLGGPYLAPEIGNQKVMRDPSVVQGPDGTFHMVWTSSWRGDLGFGYASTTDFINWSEQQFIEVMTDTSTVNVWAPELFYDDGGERFIIIWASTIPFKFEKGEEEERNNHRMYYTTTRDFKTFTETKLFLDPGFSVIDCVIVKRKKDDYVLVLKDNTRPNRNISVAFGKSPLGPFDNYSEPFTGFLTEGPTAVKIGNDYLIYYDSYGDKSYRAVKTSDFTVFTDISGDISLPEGHKHGTIVKVSKDVIDKLLQAKSEKFQ